MRASAYVAVSGLALHVTLRVGQRLPSSWQTEDLIQDAPLMRLHSVILVIIALMLLAACGEKSSALFRAEPKGRFSDDERKEVRAEIATLAQGKDHSDIEASAAYSQGVEKLTSRGSKVEPELIEALAGNQDWAIRLGVIEVLESVGTKACIEALIEAIRDPAPLVALRANTLLETMTDHHVIPAAGSPPSPEGLPPVPRRKPEELALDAEEKLWSAWHREYGKLLHATWLDWWKANRGTVKVH
jgi:hypothetical protein